MGAAGDPRADPHQGRAVIEAWRGVAAALVMYVHFWAFSAQDWPPLRLAHTGVDLFFVVSGFVFAPYLFGRPLAWRAHAVRRFFRIYPAYLAALAVYAGMKAANGQPLLFMAEHLSFLHVQSKEMAFYYNPPFWSLPAEVEFYLVLPLLAGAARAAHRRWGAPGPQVLVLALLAAAAALRWALGWGSDGQAQNMAFIALHHLPGVLVEFLLGAVAWLVSAPKVRALPGPAPRGGARKLGTTRRFLESTRPLSPWLRCFMAAAGLAGWTALALWFGRVGDAGVDASPARGLVGALAAVCFALMVAASVRTMAPPAGPPSPGLRAGLHTLAQWSGRLSYGVYLFHMAALRLAETWAPGWGLSFAEVRVLAVVLTLAMAAAVYLAWENPWRLLGRRWAARLET